MTVTIESEPTGTSFHLVAVSDSSSSETPSPSNWQKLSERNATTDQPQRPPGYAGDHRSQNRRRLAQPAGERAPAWASIPFLEKR
jgi:hypothetical protein